MGNFRVFFHLPLPKKRLRFERLALDWITLDAHFTTVKLILHTYIDNICQLHRLDGVMINDKFKTKKKSTEFNSRIELFVRSV